MIWGMKRFITGLTGIELSGCTPSSTPHYRVGADGAGRVSLHQGSFILAEAAEGHASKLGSLAVKASTSINTLRY